MGVQPVRKNKAPNFSRALFFFFALLPCSISTWQNATPQANLYLQIACL
jgi:hypothetical protein